MTLRMQSGARGAANALRKQGLSMPDLPERDSMPYIPTDITSVEDGDLMSLFSELTAYADYASVQLAAAQVDERKAQKALDLQQNVMLVRASSTAARGDRVTILKAQMAADPKVIELSDAVEEVYAYRKLVEALYNNLERDAALISRELTRRTSHSNTSIRKNRSQT